jgi:DNA (cytosine-5)-methyltransferase 1
MHRLGHLENDTPDMPTDFATPVKTCRGRPAGSGKTVSGKGGSIDYREALDLILTAESGNSDLTEHQREELPAIVSHWLQSPSEAPILLDQSYGKKWMEMLRSHLFLKANGPVHGLPKAVKSAKPISIDFTGITFAPTEKPKFTFIDLFAGIGGFRLALQEHGGKCVFTSEWDVHAKETYFNNYGEVPFGDITKLSSQKLISAQIDILAGGFPCQPFSRAGVSARSSLGQEHGFSCETQGQLFFDIVNIAKIHRPKVILLENVGNLLSHDGGNTFRTIKSQIENDLKYKIFDHSVYNANVLVPQNRVRCIIVAFRDDAVLQWSMPKLSGTPLALGSILEKLPIQNSYTISKKLWDGHIRRSNRNIARGAGFTAFLKDLSKPSTTLVARYYKDGKECLIPQPNQPEGLPRMLTERECARLQGFPEQFHPHPSKMRAYKQFGNSVPVPLISFIAKSITKYL